MLQVVGMLVIAESCWGKEFQLVDVGSGFAAVSTAEPGVQLLLSQLHPLKVETYPVGPPSVLLRLYGAFPNHGNGLRVSRSPGLLIHRVIGDGSRLGGVGRIGDGELPHIGIAGVVHWQRFFRG